MPSQSKGYLTLNVGSSSIKFAVFDAPSLNRLLGGELDAIGASTVLVAKSADDGTIRHEWDSGKAPDTHAGALAFLIDWLVARLDGLQILAVGHRVVHGGLSYDRPVVVDEAIMSKLATLEPLAPLHQPHNLAGIRAAQSVFHGVAQIACFDTAFHSHQPFVKDCFALPRDLYDEGVRRYGFHGLSYEYIAHHLERDFPLHASGRVVIAHLGNGASMCAMVNGHSAASTMGFSALDGLPMGSRCGQLDPGVMLYLMQTRKMDVNAISNMLYKDSGLKGISGISNDMRTLEASDEQSARDAIEYFVYRAKRELGALAAAIEGLDAIVFTGGIGENSVMVRERILAGLGWLGVELDDRANRESQTIISSPRSRVLCLRIPTNEEHMIAQHVQTRMQT
ncbi:acetate/propionate family kinase [Orrella marina]|uniref:Acetate kinase n=1 Tax=Orrella marina TaxID=2163011 RepID=A0A2R4XNN3_9BURK|nr:acetate/propionate family kinase [Orrella marina]AWB35420.1 acetate kinase [Orrella marina]